ncbi:26903_t:CDS:2, partial [Gigaspora margarita]
MSGDLRSEKDNKVQKCGNAYEPSDEKEELHYSRIVFGYKIVFVRQIFPTKYQTPPSISI